MYQLRPFNNLDPPALVALWSRQPPQRGLAIPIRVCDFEQIILARQFFDRNGLIVAEKEGRVVGFAHAGFGPDEPCAAVDTDWGVTAMVMVAPEEQEGTLGQQLLAASEAYLRDRGAKVLYAGCVKPLNPFYLGLYGGSEMPGTLVSDEFRLNLYMQQDYKEIDRVTVWQNDLTQFRPAVDRVQMQHRRGLQLTIVYDFAAENWWDACCEAATDRVRFELRSKSGGPLIASLSAWSIEPLGSTWGKRAAGLCDVQVEADFRKQGVGTFLLGETMRVLRADGFSLAEAQMMHNNDPAAALYRKVRFTEVDEGIVLRKRPTSETIS